MSKQGGCAVPSVPGMACGLCSASQEQQRGTRHLVAGGELCPCCSLAAPHCPCSSHSGKQLCAVCGMQAACQWGRALLSWTFLFHKKQ